MRPQSITVVSVLLLIIGFSMAIRSIGQFFMLPGIFTFVLLINSFVGLYCYYGLWNMKRWCIPLFFVVWGIIALPFIFSSERTTMIVSLRSLYVVAVVTVFIVVVFPHKSKMTGGLLWPLQALGKD